MRREYWEQYGQVEQLTSEHMKDHMFNCGERYEDMIDYRSFTHT